MSKRHTEVGISTSDWAVEETLTYSLRYTLIAFSNGSHWAWAGASQNGSSEVEFIPQTTTFHEMNNTPVSRSS